MDDRELTAWLLLDRSLSMTFGHIDRPKALVLTELVATLARLLTRDGQRGGAVLYDHAVERVVEPRSRRNQVLRPARALLRAPTNSRPAPSLTGPLRSGLNTV